MRQKERESALTGNGFTSSNKATPNHFQTVLTIGDQVVKHRNMERGHSHLNHHICLPMTLISRTLGANSACEKDNGCFAHGHLDQPSSTHNATHLFPHGSSQRAGFGRQEQQER